MALTASTHYVIPSLIGWGLTEQSARNTLGKARLLGEATASVGGTRVVLVKFDNGKFTVSPVS